MFKVSVRTSQRNERTKLRSSMTMTVREGKAGQRREEICSTPRGPQRLPLLEVSGVSTITSELSFHSCETADCTIAMSEEYVIHDR